MLLKSSRFYLLCLLASCLFSGCSKPKTESATAVVRVGDAAISPEDWKRELQKRPNISPEQRELVFQELIRNEALYQRAKKDGFDQDPAIQQRVKQLIATAYLEKLKGPEKPKTNSADELNEYYAAHQNEFSAQERLHVAGILLRVPQKATEEKKREALDRANGILAKAQATQNSPAGFGALAREVSEDQGSRYQGGDLGLFTRADLVSAWGDTVADAIYRLRQPGDLTRVMEVPGGLMIFKLVERQPARVKTLAEVKDLVAFRLGREKEARAEKDLDAKVKAGLNIEINQKLADEIAASMSTNAAPPPSMPAQ